MKNALMRIIDWVRRNTYHSVLIAIVVTSSGGLSVLHWMDRSSLDIRSDPKTIIGLILALVLNIAIFLLCRPKKPSNEI